MVVVLQEKNLSLSFLWGSQDAGCTCDYFFCLHMYIYNVALRCITSFRPPERRRVVCGLRDAGNQGYVRLGLQNLDRHKVTRTDAEKIARGEIACVLARSFPKFLLFVGNR